MERIYNIPHVQQQSGNWCWAACCEILARHTDSALTQAQLVGLYKTVDKSVGNDDDFAGDPVVVAKVLERFLNRDVEYKYRRENEQGTSNRETRLTWDQICGDLDEGKLMIIGVLSHAYVVVGYRVLANGTKCLVVNDPAQALGQKLMPYDRMYAGWRYRVSLTDQDRMVRWKRESLAVELS